MQKKSLSKILMAATVFSAIILVGVILTTPIESTHIVHHYYASVGTDVGMQTSANQPTSSPVPTSFPISSTASPVTTPTQTNHAYNVSAGMTITSSNQGT